MATTITITCPECDKQLKAPASVEGKKIRCKSCGNVFAAKADLDEVEAVEEVPAKKAPARAAPAKAAPAKPAPAKGKDKAPPAKSAKAETTPKAKVEEDEDEDGNPYKVTDLNDAARCPECANEMESEEAVICLHCGFNTITRERARTRKVRDVTGGDVFIWLLPGIACVVAIIALIVFDVLYCVCAEDWFDQDAWYSFLSSYGVKIWLVIPSLFLIYKAGYFAVKRLILNPTPPEIEEK
jgi:hypothetical protein